MNDVRRINRYKGMFMKFKPYTYFLCALALILILISPWLILTLYRTPPEAAVYKGIVRLWHITEWRTGGSSAASFLRKRAAEFESRNPYVIIEVTAMNADDAQHALLRGEMPDIISYPYGFDPAFALAPLPPRDIAVSLPDSTSYPYMCGGCCILINTDMAEQNNLYLEDDWGIRPDDLLSAAAFGACFDAEDGYTSLPAIALHTYPADTAPNISTWPRPPLPDAALNLIPSALSDGLTSFCDEESCVLIASHRQLFDVRQRYMQGDAPQFGAYALGGYTDMVQCISVGICDDILKQSVCTAFAEYLLSNSAQTKLQALGVLPVVPGLEIYEDDACLSAMYQLMMDDPAVVTPLQSTSLNALCTDAFAGDSAALRQLRQQLR